MGEILLRGNVVMKGYLKDEAATEAAFEGGWFHTGDLGRWADASDDDGGDDDEGDDALDC